MDCTCITADDGERALALFYEMTPDLAVLDITMPGLSGLEVCSRIKETEEGAYVPVLILTARDQLQDKVSALENGADDYLTKPFHIQELQARAQALLRMRELHLQLQAKNRELQRMQQKLVEQERQLVATQLAGGAAHRLGQPISAIILNSYLLNCVPPSDDRWKTAVQAIHADARRLSEMLEQLRSVNAQKTEEYYDGVDILKVGEEPERS